MLKNYLITFLARYLIYGLFLTLPLLWLKKFISLTLKILISVALAYFISSAIKYFFPVERPFVAENLVSLIGLVEGSSFPSEHTAMSSAFAVSVLLEKKTLGLMMLVASIAIGLARIAAFVHYPIDIIAGFALGTVVAYVVHRLHVYF